MVLVSLVLLVGSLVILFIMVYIWLPMNSIGAAHTEVMLLTLIAVGGYWMERQVIFPVYWVYLCTCQ